MKGGYNGLRAKQLSLFLMAVFCTSILIFGWVKSPIFASLSPPKSRVVNLPPGSVSKDTLHLVNLDNLSLIVDK